MKQTPKTYQEKKPNFDFKLITFELILFSILKLKSITLSKK